MTEEDMSELEEYAYLDGCELGDYIIKLLEVRRYNDNHGMGEEFSLAMDDELEKQLEFYRQNTVIETVVEKQPDLVSKELVWL
jgi:hypothetical protein